MSTRPSLAEYILDLSNGPVAAEMALAIFVSTSGWSIYLALNERITDMMLIATLKIAPAPSPGQKKRGGSEFPGGWPRRQILSVLFF